MLRLRLTALIVALAAPIWAPSGNAHAEAHGKDGATITQTSGGRVVGKLPLAKKKGQRRSSDTTTKQSHSRTSRPKKQLVKRVDSKMLVVATTIMCREARDAFISCTTAPAARKHPEPAQVRRDLAAVARTLVTRIQVPDPKPQIGPDPVVNEWKMAAVGYPLWLWTAGPGTVTDRVRAYGVTFTLRARWVSTRFDMGDGHSVSCTRTQVYRRSTKPGSRAPHCGYTYARASLPRGSFTVRATTNWRISWSALGMSGSMPASFTGSRTLPVGELNALIVK